MNGSDTSESFFVPLQIYAIYLNLIVNICLPLALLISMNICIYRTMRSQWYPTSRAARGSSSATLHTNTCTTNPTSNHGHGGGGGHMTTSSNRLNRRRSSSIENQVTSATIRRVGGLPESEFKKRDSKYTRASVVMVVAFVVCNTPRFVPNIMEIFIKGESFPKV